LDGSPEFERQTLGSDVSDVHDAGFSGDAPETGFRYTSRRRVREASIAVRSLPWARQRPTSLSGDAAERPNPFWYTFYT